MGRQTGSGGKRACRILGTTHEGTMEAAGVDGVWRIYGYVPVQAGNRTVEYVIVGVPYEQVRAPVSQASRLNFSIPDGVTAMALLAAWIEGELLLLWRVKALLLATRRLARGDLAARSGLPYGVGEFARSSDEMAESLEQAQRSSQLLFENMPAGLVKHERKRMARCVSWTTTRPIILTPSRSMCAGMTRRRDGGRLGRPSAAPFRRWRPTG
ncbi:MAG: hypothetical protein ACP5SI_10370 [Chloroflexia bacterium]